MGCWTYGASDESQCSLYVLSIALSVQFRDKSGRGPVERWETRRKER